MRIILALVALALSSGMALAQPPGLPDPKLTPGVARPLTLAQVCSTKWGKDVRHVTDAMKRQVFDEYGIPKGNNDPRGPFEVDHLISRELGGADDVRNLWPQSFKGPWNAHQKDRLENKLHKLVCSGALKLKDAQAMIAADWIGTYKRYIGPK